MANKNILVSLCGTSPAVITEAIWALAEEGVVLDEVAIITTIKGKEEISKQLFGEGNKLKALREHLQAEYSKFKFSNTGKYVNILSNTDDGESVDIQQTDDAIPTGNDILDILRKYTEKPQTKVFFSIAGGRKSMTAMGALCMSLVGRKQDELCHVLVNDKLVFADPSFYFPSNTMHTYKHKETKEEEEIEGSTAKITLSKIPYVRMRNLFKDKFDSVPTYYSELVDQANTIALGKPSKKKLVIDTKKAKVFINDKDQQLTEQPFAVLWCIASQKELLSGTNELKLACEDFANTLDDINLTIALKPEDKKRLTSVFSKLKKLDIFSDKRAHYGLDFDKVDVKFI